MPLLHAGQHRSVPHPFDHRATHTCGDGMSILHADLQMPASNCGRVSDMTQAKFVSNECPESGCKSSVQSLLVGDPLA
jgi:hypothetical protein